MIGMRQQRTAASCQVLTLYGSLTTEQVPERRAMSEYEAGYETHRELTAAAGEPDETVAVPMIESARCRYRLCQGLCAGGESFLDAERR